MGQLYIILFAYFLWSSPKNYENTLTYSEDKVGLFDTQCRLGYSNKRSKQLPKPAWGSVTIVTWNRKTITKCNCTVHFPLLANSILGKRSSTTGWPQSSRKNSLGFPGFSRAINLLFHRLLQQKVNVIMTFIKGHDDPAYPVNSCFTQIFEWRTKNTFVCYNFSLRLHRIHRIPWEFHVFSMFKEIPKYSRFSRFVATV